MSLRLIGRVIVELVLEVSSLEIELRDTNWKLLPEFNPDPIIFSIDCLSENCVEAIFFDRKLIVY